MKKIGQVLIDSQETRQQITGSLTSIDMDSREINGYCAIGALGCEAKILDKDHRNHGYDAILLAYGLSNYLKKPLKMRSEYGHYITYIELTSVIVHLNDTKKWSFKKIGKKLLDLQKKGYFKRIRGVKIVK